jgi:hypothetical protein
MYLSSDVFCAQNENQVILYVSTAVLEFDCYFS